MDVYKVDADPASLVRTKTTATLRMTWEDGRLVPIGNSDPTTEPGMPKEEESRLEESNDTPPSIETLDPLSDEAKAGEVVEIEAYIPSGYWVQYTDAAQKQVESLGSELRDRVSGAVKSVATMNPRSQSTQVSDMVDRRRIKTEGILVTFWLSEVSPMKQILTVIDVSREAEMLQAEAKPAEVTSLARKPMPYTTYIEDPGEAGRRLHRVMP